MGLVEKSVRLALLAFLIFAVEGCGRLKCYKCNSQDSPTTCGESNFDSSVHAGDTVTGGTTVNVWSAGSSCIRGWARNAAGTYYYRDKSNQGLWDGCETPEMCACNEDLCNSKGSPVVSMTPAATMFLLSISLASILIKKII